MPKSRFKHISIPTLGWEVLNNAELEDSKGWGWEVQRGVVGEPKNR